MTTAHEIAIQLRKLADSLDSQPEMEMKSARISWHYYGKDEKDLFLAAARIIPRPLVKSESYENVYIEHKTDALVVAVSIPQKDTCIMVEPAKPAKFRCEPILSEEEDALLEVK